MSENLSGADVTIEPLLRPEFPTNDPRCLPFVRDCTRAERRSLGTGRLFWAPDSLPKHWQMLSEGQQGIACAAAWLLYLKINSAATGVTANGDGHLVWIMSEIPLGDRRGVSFCLYLAQYLVFATKTLNDSQLLGYAERRITRDREVMMHYFGTPA